MFEVAGVDPKEHLRMKINYANQAVENSATSTYDSWDRELSDPLILKVFSCMIAT
ncbi:MAG: hypothetical protein P1U36_02375 [Legionellaceae bacterium]|nr:hypothetical protein [Legionellaceae bacterium]